MNAALLHERAVSLAKTYKQSESGLLEVLISMQRTDAFRHLQYPNLFIYCTQGLGLSEAQACYFSKVARKSEEVPALKAAIDDGTLSLSQARRVVAVITTENSKEWIEKAATLPQRELERAVTVANPKSAVREKIRPITPARSELRVGISLELEAKLRRVREVLAQNKKQAVSLEVTLEEMVSLFLKHKDPVEKAKRVKSLSLYGPAHCKRNLGVESKSASSGKSKAVKTQGLKAPKPSPRRLTAKTRHAVNQRDEGKCQAILPNQRPCHSRQWVEHHHVIPKAQGGADTPANLITLCSQHHKMHHLPGLPRVRNHPVPLPR